MLCRPCPHAGHLTQSLGLVDHLHGPGRGLGCLSAGGFKLLPHVLCRGNACGGDQSLAQ